MDAIETVRTYDPCSTRVQLGLQYETIWQDQLLKTVETSIRRFFHYVNSDECIRKDELTMYQKKWTKRALELVPDYLLETFEYQCKEIFYDIMQDYVRAMKTAIMNYILLSPNERQRLHILALPHEVLTASER